MPVAVLLSVVGLGAGGPVSGRFSSADSYVMWHLILAALIPGNNWARDGQDHSDECCCQGIWHRDSCWSCSWYTRATADDADATAATARIEAVEAVARADAAAAAARVDAAAAIARAEAAAEVTRADAAATAARENAIAAGVDMSAVEVGVAGATSIPSTSRLLGRGSIRSASVASG